MVGSGSTTSKSWGCSYACVCMRPPWEIPQAPDGNNLYKTKGENKELLCLMENLSQNNLVRSYLAGRAYTFCFLFLWDWSGWDCNFFFLFFYTIRNMSIRNSIYIPDDFPCSVATELLIFCSVCMWERKTVHSHTHTCGYLWQRIVKGLFTFF